jgi:hypothetical protein
MKFLVSHPLIGSKISDCNGHFLVLDFKVEFIESCSTLGSISGRGGTLRRHSRPRAVASTNAAAGVTRTAGWYIVAPLLSLPIGLIWKMANFIAVLA